VEQTRSVTVRDLPLPVHARLAARAAGRRQSLGEYLRDELMRLADAPSAEELEDRLRARKAATRTRLDVDEVLTARDADRA
jgi:hypothetical protein